MTEFKTALDVVKAGKTVSLACLEAFILEPGCAIDLEFPLGSVYNVQNISQQPCVIAVDERGHVNFCRTKACISEHVAPVRVATDPWADYNRSLR